MDQWRATVQTQRRPCVIGALASPEAGHALALKPCATTVHVEPHVDLSPLDNDVVMAVIVTPSFDRGAR